MGLRVDPSGGGQFNGVIKKIIEAESKPIKTLEGRKGKEEARLKLFQEFKGKVSTLDTLLSEMSNFKKFRELKVVLGAGEELMEVTLDKERAEPGRYEIEIEELAMRGSSISNGFEDPDEPVLGMGFITVDLPDGETDEILIEEDQSSLHKIADLINHRRNSPVQAAVIKDVAEPDAPWKLLITSKQDGEGRSAEIPSFYFLDGAMDFYVYDDREAKNAAVSIDGFPFELEGNDVTDFLPGVNLHLKGAKPDQPFFLDISLDYEKIIGKVKGMLDQVNQVLQFIYKQNAIDQHSDTSTTFAGDSTFQSMEYRIRNTFHQGYEAFDPHTKEDEIIYLSHLGIEFDRSGQITLKPDRLKHKLETDFDVVADAFVSPDGIVSALRELVSSYTGLGSGFLSVKEQGIRSRIKEIDRQIDDKTKHLERRSQNLVGQFSRLEGTLGQLKSQQAYLNATLPGAAGAAGALTQLIG